MFNNKWGCEYGTWEFCGEAPTAYDGRNYYCRKYMMNHLDPILSRPEMYVASSIELAALVNGYMMHRTGFMNCSFGMVCIADSTKTIRENATIFKEQVDAWEKENEDRPSYCCVDFNPPIRVNK